MSRLIINNTSAVPVQPAAGKIALFGDTVNKALKQIDENAFVQQLGVINNFSVGSQSPAGVTRTYITGSRLQIGPQKVQAGSTFQWTFNLTKTASGSGASTFDIAVGTAGSTADTARISFAKPAGTASADEGTVEIRAICRTVNSTSAILSGNFTLIHNLSATGHAVIPCVCVNSQSAAFDMTTANLSLGICVSTGPSDSVTIQQVHAVALNI